METARLQEIFCVIRKVYTFTKVGECFQEKEQSIVEKRVPTILHTKLFVLSIISSILLLALIIFIRLWRKGKFALPSESFISIFLKRDSNEPDDEIVTDQKNSLSEAIIGNSVVTTNNAAVESIYLTDINNTLSGREAMGDSGWKTGYLKSLNKDELAAISRESLEQKERDRGEINMSKRDRQSTAIERKSNQEENGSNKVNSKQVCNPQEACQPEVRQQTGYVSDKACQSDPTKKVITLEEDKIPRRIIDQDAEVVTSLGDCHSSPTKNLLSESTTLIGETDDGIVENAHSEVMPWQTAKSPSLTSFEEHERHFEAEAVIAEIGNAYFWDYSDFSMDKFESEP